MSGAGLDLAALLQRWAATISASHGVNPYLFIALTTLCAPLFYYSIFRLTKALANRQRHQVSVWSSVFLGTTALPYGYVLAFGRNLPWWIYLVLGALLAQGVVALVRKLTTGADSPVARARLRCVGACVRTSPARCICGAGAGGGRRRPTRLTPRRRTAAAPVSTSSRA